MKLNIRNKLLLCFISICAIIGAAGGLSLIQLNSLYDAGRRIVNEDFPADDAVMEIQYLIGKASITLEGIIAGSAADNINTVTDIISHAREYCIALSEGGEVAGKRYRPLWDNNLINQVDALKLLIDSYHELSLERYNYNISAAGEIGSEADQRFDEQYRKIKDAVDLLLPNHPQLGRQLTETKYLLADAHIFLEEYLSGDRSVERRDVTNKFKAVNGSFSSLPVQSDIPQLNDLATLIKLLIESADNRIAVKESAYLTEKKLAADFAETYKRIDRTSVKLHDLIMRDTTESMARVETTNNRSRTIIVAASLLCFLASLIIGYFLADHFSAPIEKLIIGLEKMAAGDLSEDVNIVRDDEIGDIARSFAEVQISMREAARLADQVAGGDYAVSITHKSGHDRLRMALHNMTSQLARMKQDNQDQFWLANTHAGLVEVLRGELNLENLGNNISRYLAEKLDARVVSFYVAAEGGELVLSGGYGLDRGRTPNTVGFGQGLLGQAAVDKELIHITDIPDDSIRISSSLGECMPRELVVSPFMHERVVKGVIELGSATGFNDINRRLLSNAMESIAIAVHGAEVHAQMNRLLAESQSQTEELQVQQEELQAANEELEEKTRELLKSEARLQAQQEELETTNSELIVRSGLLEKQKDEIAVKARELELAGKYKSEFLANMSHELRTPLNSILILSRLLYQDKENSLSKKQRSFAETINSSGKDLLELINEVLDLAKVESGKMKMVAGKTDLKGFISEVERAYAPMAGEKQLAFSVTIEDQAPEWIITDQQRLRQVLNNLLGNAVKFTERGEVSLHIAPAGAQANLSASGLNPSQAVAFHIRDTGIGIAVDRQQAIFEAFYQEDGATNRKYGGTGLGLSIAREMASFLGGEIQLESEPGKGSTFTLYLPLEAKPLPAEAAEEKCKPIACKPRRERGGDQTPESPPGAIEDDRNRLSAGDRILLIIDDEKEFAGLMIKLGHEKKYKCIIAVDGESGLQCAKLYRPDAIILDIGLPGMDGWEVMDRLKENPETRHIPVHFITAADQPQNGMLRGAAGFLTKPVSEEALHKALQKLDSVLANKTKRLLIVEDDTSQRQSIAELVSGRDITISAVASGREALALLKSQDFDCMVLDLGLKDISGFELLETIKDDETIPRLPIIIYTGRELTREQEEKLEKFAESIIVKGARSPERLLAETTLFLHRVESQLPEEKRKTPASFHNPEAMLKGRNILIVDDDMRNVFALASFLQDKGLEVRAGKNGREALDMLQAHPETELVIMDVMMPEMDGYEAMEKIRSQERFRDLPIIALTAKAMKGDRGKCLEAGANDYLSKPVDIDRLYSLLRIWLHK